MSMRYYGFHAYGLLLDGDELKRYFAPSDSEEAWEIADRIGLCCEGDFSGDAFPINDDGTEEWWSPDSFDGDPIYYAPISRYPSLVSAVYKSIDEIVSELRQQLCQYLPQDFDYRSHLRSIVGVYYG